MSFLVSTLVALSVVGAILAGALFLGVLNPGGTATPSFTPGPSGVPLPTITSAPTAQPTPTAEPTSTAQPTPGGTYIVQEGDLGLSVIGVKFGIPWQLIAEANNLQPPYTIHVGDVLIIPALPVPSDGSQIYVVQPGDNLIDIATKLGVDWTDLADFNNIADAGAIQPGMILYVPGPGWTPRPTPTTSARPTR